MDGVPVVAEARHHAGGEVLHEDVGLADERLEHLAVGVVLEVERDGLLAGVGHGEEAGALVGRDVVAAAVLALDERRGMARDVAGARQLDLDDAGAEVAHCRNSRTGRGSGRARRGGEWGGEQGRRGG